LLAKHTLHENDNVSKTPRVDFDHESDRDEAMSVDESVPDDAMGVESLDETITDES
jgi:hypothetical protein